MKKYFLFLLTFLLISACQGTETGNPAFTGAQGVSTQYPNTWSYAEHAAPAPSSFPVTGDPTGPQPITQPSIPTSEASFTIFTDGQSSVTIYYVTLSSTTDLLSYLQAIFPTRTFSSYSNGVISGYYYDNPDVGATGGDLREYYFLNNTKLVYIVTDLFPAATLSYMTIINSLRY